MPLPSQQASHITPPLTEPPGGGYGIVLTGSFNVGPNPATILAWALADIGGSLIRIDSIVIGGQTMVGLADRSMGAEMGQPGRARAFELIGSNLTEVQEYTVRATLLTGTPDENSKPSVNFVSYRDVVSAVASEVSGVGVSSGGTFSASITAAVAAKAVFLGMRVATSVTPAAGTSKDVDDQMGNYKALALSKNGTGSATIMQVAAATTDAFVGQVWALLGSIAAPIITSSEKFNVVAGTTSVGTMMANQSVTWDKNGGADAGLFTINASTGALAIAPQTYDSSNPANNVRVVGVRATNGSSGAATRVVTVYVRKIGDAWPATDAMTTGWTSTPAGSCAAALDEGVADDANYITSPTLSSTSSTAEMELQAPLPAGNYVVKVRANVDTGTGSLQVELVNGSGAQQGISADKPISTTLTTYDLPIMTTGVATRVRIHVHN